VPAALPATLYALPASHPCAAIEVAMRLKGVPYRRVDMIPVMSKLLQWKRFGGFTVPGVVFEDGEKVLGSREILRSLEHRAMEPHLLPLDGRERRTVEEAELWGDQVLQPLARRIVWAGLRRRSAAMMSYSVDADLPVPRWMARLSAPLIAAAGARFNRAADPEIRADLINLDLHLDRADHWVKTGAIGGTAHPNAGDLQVGSGLALLLTVADLRGRIEGRVCADVARRWFPDYPGELPPGTLPAEWLAARAP
jgi:glutathione S-transferase